MDNYAGFIERTPELIPGFIYTNFLPKVERDFKTGGNLVAETAANTDQIRFSCVEDSFEPIHVNVIQPYKNIPQAPAPQQGKRGIIGL